MQRSGSKPGAGMRREVLPRTTTTNNIPAIIATACHRRRPPTRIMSTLCAASRGLSSRACVACLLVCLTRLVQTKQAATLHFCQVGFVQLCCCSSGAPCLFRNKTTAWVCCVRARVRASDCVRVCERNFVHARTHARNFVRASESERQCPLTILCSRLHRQYQRCASVGSNTHYAVALQAYPVRLTPEWRRLQRVVRAAPNVHESAHTHAHAAAAVAPLPAPVPPAPAATPPRRDKRWDAVKLSRPRRE